MLTATEQPVDITAVAEFISVCTRTAERLIIEGGLPQPFRVGAQRRWLLSEVIEHLKQQRETAAAR